MNASPSGIGRHWRVAAAMALCAGAGVGLRMAGRESGGRGASAESAQGGAGKGTGAAAIEKAHGKAKSPARPSVELLLELTVADRVLAVAAWLPAFSAAEISMLVHAQLGLGGTTGARIGDDEVADGYLRALFTRWAELNPDGMIAALESPALQYEQETRQLAVLAWAEVRGTAALEAVGKKWPRLAQRAAWEVLMRSPGSMESLLPWLRNSLGDGGLEMTATAEQMLQLLGPERAVVLAAAAGSGRDLDFVLSAIAAENFPRALAAAKALPAGAVREQAVQDLLGELDALSRREAPEVAGLDFKKEYEALPPGRTRDALADEYATILARESPDKALEWARALPPGESRGDAIRAAGYALEAAGHWAAATKIFAEAWGCSPTSPEWEYYTDSFSGSSFPEGGPANRAFGEWYKADASAALAWLESSAPPALQVDALRPLVRDGLADISLLPDSWRQLSLATEYLRALTEPREKNAPPLPQINLPPDLERVARLQLVERSDAAWAGLSTEDRHFLSVEQMASRMIFGPEDGLELFNSMTPEERSLGAWYQAGRGQAEVDLGQASEWLDTLPPGPERDAAATGLVDRLTAEGDDRDGEAAFAWAVNMSGAEERRRYIEQAARAWAKDDPEAATKAVLASGLSPEETVQLVEEMKKGGTR
jgi:hypothetical protein